ncbi:MAG TPA: TIGR03067 domain-containing protein [Gemmata sp.]
MRRTLGLGLALAVVALGCGKKDSPAPGAPGGAVAPASLEGGWKIVVMESAGEKNMIPAGKATNKIRATATQLIATTAGGKDDPLNYKLDPSKTPHEIDLTETDEKGKRLALYGIYKLEGDTLTICVVESENPADRPKEFKTSKESKARIMVLKKD